MILTLKALLAMPGATNVNVVATQKGLYEGVETMDTAAAITRDNAAQMVWNALQAVEVKYEYTLVSENGELVSKTTLVEKDKTLLADKYSGAGVYEGVLTGSGKFNYNSDNCWQRENCHGKGR